MPDQTEELLGLAKRLRGTGAGVSDYRVVVGLDGFIDMLSRVVSSRESRTAHQSFETITDFSGSLGRAAGKSAQYELDRYATKLGGNAPIMSMALSSLGVSTTCLGAVGYPEMDPIFSPLAEKAEVVSYANPGITNAFEFNDGKLMFADFRPFTEVSWETFQKRVPKERLKQMLSGSGLLALVDWSNIFGVEEIWAGLIREVVEPLAPAARPSVFFDLADPSARKQEDIREAIETIRLCGRLCPTTLGLNLNEAEKVLIALSDRDLDRDKGEAKEITESLMAFLPEVTLAVHPRDYSVSASGGELAVRKGKVVSNPRISTGGGDNFNAGFCLGVLLGESAPSCLLLGMAMSCSYVSEGRSPSISELADFVENWASDLG